MAAAPLISESGITMAVITPDSIAGTLDDSETQGLCWLAGDLSGIYIPVKTSEGTEDFFVRSSKTRLDAKLQGSNINITVQITINGNLQGSSNEDTQAVHKEIADRISALCADAAQKTVNDFGADVFGIEKCILSSGVVSDYNWQEIIPRLNFIYRIKIRE
jgi:hypothetical protein